MRHILVSAVQHTSASNGCEPGKDARARYSLGLCRPLFRRIRLGAFAAIVEWRHGNDVQSSSLPRFRSFRPGPLMSRSTHVTAAATLSMVGASLCFATLDATGKFLVQTFPAPFVVWVRYIVQTALLLVILAPRMRGNLLCTRSFALQILRGVLLVVSSVLIVTGFRTLPLAEATALCFFAPAIVTVLAIVLLGEHVTRARSVCVVAGLIGVLLIARPGSSIFQPAALFPLAGALTSACYQPSSHESSRARMRVRCCSTRPSWACWS